MKISCTERIAKSKRPSNREAKAGTRSRAIKTQVSKCLQKSGKHQRARRKSGSFFSLHRDNPGRNMRVASDQLPRLVDACGEATLLWRSAHVPSQVIYGFDGCAVSVAGNFQRESSMGDGGSRGEEPRSADDTEIRERWLRCRHRGPGSRSSSGVRQNRQIAAVASRNHNYEKRRQDLNNRDQKGQAGRRFPDIATRGKAHPTRDRRQRW